MRWPASRSNGALWRPFAELVRQSNEPVADVGWRAPPDHPHPRQIGLDSFGKDLSRAMIDVARRDHPARHFEVGSMPDLDRADSSLIGSGAP